MPMKEARLSSGLSPGVENYVVMYGKTQRIDAQGLV